MRVLVVVAVVVAASMSVVLVLSLHTGCTLGGEVGLFNVTAPAMLVNIPDNGSAGSFQNAMNWTISSGSLTLGGLPTQEPTSGYGGTVLRGSGLQVVGGQPIFAVYSVRNTTTFSGTVRPCTQPYVAQPVGPGYCGLFFAGLRVPDPTNDSVEPNVLNQSCPNVPANAGIESGAYMWFDSAFPSGNPASAQVVTLNLCGWTTNFTHDVWGEVGVPIVLHVPHAGRAIAIQGYMAWQSWLGGNTSTATYVIPGGAIWRVASIGEYSLNDSLVLPPGLLAFERIPC